jgi:hypothetical protein
MIWLARLTAPEAARLARDPKAVVFLPLGAIEQHGPHLPLLVDWRGAEELARRVAPHLRRRSSSRSRPTGGWCGNGSRDACPPAWFDFRGALARGERNFRRRGPGGAGYFGWPAAARAKTGCEAMALRGRLIAERLVRALGNRPRS